MLIECVSHELVSREKILRLEREIGLLPQHECPLDHFFCDHGYARVMHIKAGVILAGRIHKQSTISVVSGLIAVATDQGERLIDARGRPEIVVSPAGTKRIGHAQTDTIWIQFFGTDSKDPEWVYNNLSTATFEEYQQFCKEQLLLEGAH